MLRLKSDRLQTATAVCLVESRVLYVDAETREEALSLARQKYQHGDFILEPGHLLDVKFIPLATDEE